MEEMFRLLWEELQNEQKEKVIEFMEYLEKQKEGRSA